VLVMTEPSGARCRWGKQTVLVSPFCLAPGGRHDHVIRSTSFLLDVADCAAVSAARTIPTLRRFVAGPSCRIRHAIEVEQIELAQVQHDYP